MWLSMSFMHFGSNGASIGVSQSLGGGDRDKAKEYAQNSLTLSVILGIAYGLLMIVFRSQMVGFFAFREQAVIRDAEIYLSAVATSIPITFVTATISAIYTASGNSRVPLLCNLVGISLNVVLDPLLIFSARLGIFGAAAATVIGQTTVCVMLCVMFWCHKSRPFDKIKIFIVPRREELRQIVRWVAPIATEEFLFTFFSMVVSRRMAYFGAGAMAVNRVGSQIESITWLLGGTFGAALISFVGQNYGARKSDRIRSTFKIASIVMLGFGAFASFILLVPGPALFFWFLPDASLSEMSASYLFVFAFCQIPMCVDGVSSNMFRGLGRTMPPAIVGTVVSVLRVPLAYLFSMTPLGLTGVWIGLTVSQFIKCAWSFSWYSFAQKRLTAEF
jgi:putative MATE family efflux protein